jgi:molecular chaperone GrpE
MTHPTDEPTELPPPAADASAEPSPPDAAPAPGAEPADPIATLEAELAAANEKYLRLYAEFENFRRRAARERLDAEHHGQRTVIKGLLDALDDLGRFAHLDPAQTDARTVVDGAAMVEKKVLKSLAGHGLEVIDPADAAFDPALHEALTTVPAATAEEDHLVAQVYQLGYVLNGQLVRPARVVVKQWTAPSA